MLQEKLTFEPNTGTCYTGIGWFVKYTWGPFDKHGLTLIPAWISNNIHYNVWDEITYPFPNFNGTTLKFGNWGMDK